MTATADISGVFDRLGALADPTRGRLLMALEGHELTVRELQAVLRLPQSTVSRHLKVLADLGLATSREQGTSNWYRMPADLEPAVRRLWLAIREELAGSTQVLHDAARLRPILARRRLASQHFFRASAGEWDEVRGQLFGARMDLAALPALLEETWVVGDLGCGTGSLVSGLAPFVRRVIGVDESDAMLAAARARTEGMRNVELRRGTLEDLPVKTEELDAALLLLVLHHTADPARVLAEAHRSLRPGGRVLIVDMLPHEHVEYRERMGHQWLGFAETELRSWLEADGFRETRMIPLPTDPEAKGPPLFAMTARAVPADRLLLTDALPPRGLT